MRHTKRRRGGFTLIELLVVVAIIAVLISILLPSLSAAKRVAKRVVCASNLRQLAIGMTTYAEEGDEWIIGSPNGSGFAAHDPAIGSRTDVLATTIYDWANPMTPYLGRNSIEIPVDRLERMFKTRLGVFKCPESNETMVQYPIQGTGPWSVQNSNSYVTIWKMLLVGDAFRNQNQQTDPYTVPWHTYGDWETKAPKQYKPRLSQVGQHSRKFFLLDGARYVTDDEIWDYDTTPTAIGSGSFSSSGPVYRDSQEYGLTKPGKFKSYRHASGEVLALNAAFFDGHVEWMTETQTRYHGYSMPTGSTLWRGAQMTPETLSILAGAYRVGDVLPD